MILNADTFDLQPVDDLYALLDNIQAQAPGDEPDEFDAFISTVPADLRVRPFNDSALVWWAHQPKLGGLRSMALDVLGTPGVFDYIL